MGLLFLRGTPLTGTGLALEALMFSLILAASRALFPFFLVIFVVSDSIVAGAIGGGPAFIEAKWLQGSILV